MVSLNYRDIIAWPGIRNGLQDEMGRKGEILDNVLLKD
jgi:hypothetical protein